MSIAITLDKSTFQSLSHDELVQLQRYYIVNVSPLLVLEILGDLSKETDKSKKLPKDVVISLANKIFPFNTFVNADYKKLLEFSLIDDKNTFSNRPFLEAAKSIKTNVRQGLVFEETPQEKSIRNWKDGNFSSLDEITSWFWRAQTTSETVIEEFKDKLSLFSKILLEERNGDNNKNLFVLRDMLFLELNKEENQKQYLGFIVDFFGIDYNVASKIFYRWESGNFKSVSEFSSYGFFCLSIVAMYYVGINNNLLSERKTNLLDLEYLYYTPCCRVFSTGDKFLISLFNLIQPADVEFISSISLKNDLNKFHQYQIEAGEVSDLPPDKNTDTFRIWDKVFDLKLSAFLKAHPKSQEELIKEFEEILQTSESNEQQSFDGEPDFVTKTFYMRPTDLCVCGSGKQLKDCHMKL